MKVLITGGAGFIGSHLVDALIEEHEIVVFDNLSSGRMEFLQHHKINPRFSFIQGDLLVQAEIENALDGIDMVYHAAANPDVRLGADDTSVHLEQNIIATYNLLEAMRKKSVVNIKRKIKIAFTSTSTVYGEATVIPTPEDYGPLIPISLYGASKLACEALITSYCHTFDMQSWIFRFANVVGNRSTHGITVDFVKKLKENPEHLEILGDGMQRKSYVYVSDCVAGMLHAVATSKNEVNIFNIGTDDTITTTEIGNVVIDVMKLRGVEFSYTGGKRGWKGDVPVMSLSIEKIKALGWEPTYNSRHCIERTAQSILEEMEKNV